MLSRTNLAYSPLTPALSPRVSEICGLFNSLCALFSPPVVCFQQLADSFCKTPGVGGTPKNSPLESATSRLFLALSAECEGFRTLEAPSLQLSIRRRMRILSDHRESKALNLAAHPLRRLRVLCVSALSFASILFALCFHILTDCFSRKSPILITIRIARVCGGTEVPASSLQPPSSRTKSFRIRRSKIASPEVLWNEQIQKIPGGGGRMRATCRSVPRMAR